MRNSLVMRLRIASGVALAGLMTTAAWANDIPLSPQVKETQKLSIAASLDYAPFQYTDDANKPIGIGVEIQQAAAELLGVEWDLIKLPFTSMIPGLAAGRFEIAWATFTPTAERLEQVHFVTYGKDGLVASTTPDKVSMFSGDNPLCGKNLGIAAGAAADFIADEISADCKAKGLPEIVKHSFPLVTDVIQAVLSDRIDARFDNLAASSYFEVTSNGQLVVVPTIFDEAPMAIAVTKNDPAVADMMQAAIQKLIDNGTYGAAFKKYGMENSTVTEAYIIRDIGDIRK